MKKNNGFFKAILALSVTAALFSCNGSSSDNSTTTKDSAAATKDSTASMPTPPAPAPAGPTVPFDVVTVYHTIKDYKVWRPVFDADSTRRKAAGLTDVAVERAADKPDNIKLVFMVSDMAKAKALASDPGLKQTMDKAGVISKPEMKYWKIVRFNPENLKANDNRLEVVHKVKDFDTWLKGYDAEGPATRAANGMNDLAIGRGIDDSNLVHLVFEVTDIAKAKARMADPALKKIMMDAGVEGAPSVHFYQDASK